MAEAEELKTLPLDAFHRARGGRMVGFAGYAMPVQYDGPGGGVMAEHRWTRENAGLFDVSHMGQVRVAGDGADAWLESLAPGDFKGLAEWATRYSVLLADDGGTLDDLMATRVPGGFFMVVNGATKHADMAHMLARLPAEISLDLLRDRALLALQGPRAVDVLEAMVPGVSALKFLRSGEFLWGSVPLFVTRSGYTGEDGFEVSLAAADAEAFASALLADARVKPIGLGARDSLRLEAGLPLYGHDLDPTVSPVEGGLAFAVSKRRRAEGGFPGADRLLRELEGGSARTRVGFRVEGRLPAREGAVVFVGGEQVGRVTSGGFAPSVDAPVGMALLDARAAAVGTALEIEVRGRRLAATVVPLPFWQKKYVR